MTHDGAIQLEPLPDHVEAELEKSNSKRLRKTLRKIWSYAQNAKQTKEMEVEVYYGDSNLTWATIDSVEDEKTITSGHAHFVLGPRGGLRTAEFDGFASAVDYAQKTNAWYYIKHAFDRMR